MKNKEKLRILNIDLNNLHAFNIQISLLKEILKNNSKAMPTLVGNSYSTIYGYIYQQVENFGARSLNLVNIDMNPNLGRRFEINYNKWLTPILEDFPDSKISWIINPISKDFYDRKSLSNISKVIYDNLNNISTYTSIEKIKDMEFDIIFLCKDMLWMTPQSESESKILFNYVFENLEFIDNNKKRLNR